jgi:hypothetical protein
MLLNFDLLAVFGTGKPELRGQNPYLSFPSGRTHRHALIATQKKYLLIGFEHVQYLFE